MSDARGGIDGKGSTLRELLMCVARIKGRIEGRILRRSGTSLATSPLEGLVGDLVEL